MVSSYRLDNVTDRYSGSVRPAPGSAPDGIRDVVTRLRDGLNDCHHGAMILDSGGNIVFRNEALISELSPPVAHGHVGSRRTVDIVFDAVLHETRRCLINHELEIRMMIPVEQQCYALIGSLLKSSAGHVIGALVNIAEVTTSTPSPATSTGLPDVSTMHQRSQEFQPTAAPTAVESEFQRWLERRREARQKMERLSRRETQVVSLVSEGMPNKSIARELDISVKTIEKHRANATRKLGVGSTPEMVRIAVLADNPSEAPASDARSTRLPGI